MTLRGLRSLSLLLGIGLLTACSGDDSDGDNAGGTGPGGSGGQAAQGGAGPGGAGGQAGAAGSTTAGAAGNTAGKSGAAGTTGGAAGTAGSAGAAGANAGGVGGAGNGGTGGSAGAAAGTGGTAAGTAGSAGAGLSGSSGQSGSGGAGGAVDPCPKGTLCGDGNTGVCAGGECCDAARACGNVCCGASDVCSFGTCVAPGAACQDASDCGASQYCELTLGSGGSSGAAGGAGAGGATCVGQSGSQGGRCLPLPPVCPGGGGGSGGSSGGEVSCLDTCEVIPATTDFTPTLRYTWGNQLTSPFASDVMMTPIVIQLDDDDCDGKVTERDIPEIVFSTFSGGAYNGAGVLHAISVVGGQVVDKWTVSGIQPTRHLAAGNLDATTGAEVVACGNDGAVHAIRGDGSPFWTTPVGQCFMPSIADLDGDGQAEVIVEGGILDGATGTLKATFAATPTSPVVVSDITGDGVPDIVTASQIFKADGSLLLDTALPYPSSFAATSDWKAPWPAIGDFDNDGVPEVVVDDNINHAVSLWHYDASLPAKFKVVRAPVDINGTLSPTHCAPGTWGNTHGGGPPTVGDFDGDGTPDVALAGGVGYAVFSGKKLVDPAIAGSDTFLWIKQTNDCSSASTGSSIFDFNGDGKAEVLYSDQQRLRIYEGTTGNVLYETCNTTATLIENPIVADVDNDGQADIVVASNAYGAGSADIGCDGTRQSGIRIFGSASGSWVRTRRVWNQHAYHITNINEDGSVPAIEPANWKQPGLNNFRTNKQPGHEFSAPDAVVSLAPDCTALTPTLSVVVRNLGQSVLPPGVQVDVYKDGLATPIGATTTSIALYPAQAQTLPVAVSDSEVLGGQAKVHGVITTPASVKECRVDNNASATVIGTCAKL